MTDDAFITRRRAARAAELAEKQANLAMMREAMELLDHTLKAHLPIDSAEQEAFKKSLAETHAKVDAYAADIDSLRQTGTQL